MTLGEFRTFLEGFEHAFVDGVPNADQWAVVKAKLGEIAMIKPVTPTPPFVPAIERSPNKWPDMPEPLKVWYSANDVRELRLPKLPTDTVTLI